MQWTKTSKGYVIHKDGTNFCIKNIEQLLELKKIIKEIEQVHRPNKFKTFIKKLFAKPTSGW
jgi:hypothetical protein